MYEDRPGKPGWISELPRAARGSQLPLRVLRIQSSRLFDPRSTERSERHPPDHNPPLSPYPLLLVVVYLRSYEGMGVANVSVCGNVVGQIDGLWDHWRSVRVSVTDTFRTVVDAAKLCRRAAPLTVEVAHCRAPVQAPNPLYPKPWHRKDEDCQRVSVRHPASTA